MNTIAILSFIAVSITGLALIHETRLRRVAYHAICRLVRSFRHPLKERLSSGKE